MSEQHGGCQSLVGHDAALVWPPGAHVDVGAYAMPPGVHPRIPLGRRHCWQRVMLRALRISAHALVDGRADQRPTGQCIAHGARRLRDASIGCAALIEMDDGTAMMSESSAGSKSLPTRPAAEQAKGQAIESAAALVVVGVSSATFANSLSVTSWRASVIAAMRRTTSTLVESRSTGCHLQTVILAGRSPELLT